MVTLQTVESGLAAMLSDATAEPGWPPTSEQFFCGEAQLQSNASALLGGSAENGRILVTLGRGCAGPRLPADRPPRRRCRAYQLRA